MWSAIATITLTNNWQLTPPIVGTLFRLNFSHNLWGRGLIAQVPTNSPLELYAVRKLYGRNVAVFRLEKPACFPSRAIALMQYQGTPWTIGIDVWTGSPPEPTLEQVQADLQRIEAKIDLL